MKVLELFSGTGSFSNVAKERGHQIFTIDNDPQFKPDLCKDIMDVTAEEIIDKFGHPDIIWASPPCTTFSVASVYRYWDNGKPKNEKTLHGIALVKKAISLIKELKPTFFIIENPRGMLRKQDFMQGLKRDTVTYCQYIDKLPKVQKPTDLWNNLGQIFKPVCKSGSPCHEKASRGSRKGTQGIINNSFSDLGTRGKVLRAIVPKKLCEDILISCESSIPLASDKSSGEKSIPEVSAAKEVPNE